MWVTLISPDLFILLNMRYTQVCSWFSRRDWDKQNKHNWNQITHLQELCYSNLKVHNARTSFCFNCVIHANFIFASSKLLCKRWSTGCLNRRVASRQLQRLSPGLPDWWWWMWMLHIFQVNHRTFSSATSIASRATRKARATNKFWTRLDRKFFMK